MVEASEALPSSRGAPIGRPLLGIFLGGQALILVVLLVLATSVPSASGEGIRDRVLKGINAGIAWFEISVIGDHNEAIGARRLASYVDPELGHAWLGQLGAKWLADHAEAPTERVRWAVRLLQVGVDSSESLRSALRALRNEDVDWLKRWSLSLGDGERATMAAALLDSPMVSIKPVTQLELSLEVAPSPELVDEARAFAVSTGIAGQQRVAFLLYFLDPARDEGLVKRAAGTTLSSGDWTKIQSLTALARDVDDAVLKSTIADLYARRWMYKRHGKRIYVEGLRISRTPLLLNQLGNASGWLHVQERLYAEALRKDASNPVIAGNLGVTKIELGLKSHSFRKFARGNQLLGAALKRLGSEAPVSWQALRRSRMPVGLGVVIRCGI